jgi:hypothetical protein
VLKSFLHSKGRFDRTKVYDLRQLKDIAKKLTFQSLAGEIEHKQSSQPCLFARSRRQPVASLLLKQIDDIERVSEYLFGDIRQASEVGEKCFDRVLAEAKK